MIILSIIGFYWMKQALTILSNQALIWNMSETPFLPGFLNIDWLAKEREIKENIERSQKPIDELVIELVNLALTMKYCYSLEAITRPSARKLKKILQVLIDKIDSDPYYDNIKRPIKLSTMFVFCKDFGDPFAILNYGDNGILLLRILSLIDKEGFGKKPDYIDPAENDFGDLNDFSV